MPGDGRPGCCGAWSRGCDLAGKGVKTPKSGIGGWVKAGGAGPNPGGGPECAVGGKGLASPGDSCAGAADRAGLATGAPKSAEGRMVAPGMGEEARAWWPDCCA